MSMEILLSRLNESNRKDYERQATLLREQYEALIRAKDNEIATLRDEICTLKNWLDHSALPAANPISNRSDSMGLVKMNFGDDKKCPELWSPGEKEMLNSIKCEESIMPEQSRSWLDEPSIGDSRKDDDQEEVSEAAFGDDPKLPADIAPEDPFLEKPDAPSLESPDNDNDIPGSGASDDIRLPDPPKKAVMDLSRIRQIRKPRTVRKISRTSRKKS